MAIKFIGRELLKCISLEYASWVGELSRQPHLLVGSYLNILVYSKIVRQLRYFINRDDY